MPAAAAIRLAACSPAARHAGPPSSIATRFPPVRASSAIARIRWPATAVAGRAGRAEAITSAGDQETSAAITTVEIRPGAEHASATAARAAALTSPTACGLATRLSSALASAAGIVEVGPAVALAGAEVKQRRGRPAGDAAEAVGGPADGALEQGEHRPQAGGRLSSLDQMKLRGTGIGEQGVDAGVRQSAHQRAGSVLARTPRRRAGHEFSPCLGHDVLCVFFTGMGSQAWARSRRVPG